LDVIAAAGYTQWIRCVRGVYFAILQFSTNILHRTSWHWFSRAVASSQTG
jgi:hypothetical protein